MSYLRFARNMPNGVEEIFVLFDLMCAIFAEDTLKQIEDETPI